MKFLLGSMCVCSIFLNVYFYFNDSHLQNELRWVENDIQRTEKNIQLLVSLISSKSEIWNRNYLKSFLINREIEFSERVEEESVYIDFEGLTFRFELNGTFKSIVSQK